MELIIIPIAILLLGTVFFLLKTFQLPAQMKKAEEFIEVGEYSKGNEILKKILEKKKDYIPAKYLRVQMLIKQNQYLLAISELNSILTIPGFNKVLKELQIHYHLAYLYNQTKNWSKEIEEYRMILKFNKNDIKANHRIGHAFYKQGKYKEAKDHLTRAVVFDQNLIDCYLPLGIACFHISDYDNAEQYLSMSLNKTGDTSEAQYYLGSIYKMKKDHDSAILMFEKSKTNRKFFIESLQSIGEIYHSIAQYEDAINKLEEGLSSLKDNTEESHSFRYLLAECYENVNKIGDAVDQWNKILSENPSYRSTKVKLDAYKNIMGNQNIMSIFTSSLEELQPLITDFITGLHYNIISKGRISPNKYQYKAYNIKRINDPPVLILFHRTTKEITEVQVTEFHNAVSKENCKNGIYITTAKFSLRAKSSASSKMIDLFDSDYLSKFIEKSNATKKR